MCSCATGGRKRPWPGTGSDALGSIWQGDTLLHTALGFQPSFQKSGATGCPLPTPVVGDRIEVFHNIMLRSVFQVSHRGFHSLRGKATTPQGSFSIASRVVRAARWRMAQLLPSTHEVRAGTVSGNSQNSAAASATPSARVFRPMNQSLDASAWVNLALFVAVHPNAPRYHVVRRHSECGSEILVGVRGPASPLPAGVGNLLRRPWHHKCRWQDPHQYA